MTKSDGCSQRDRIEGSGADRVPLSTYLYETFQFAQGLLLKIHEFADMPKGLDAPEGP